MELNIDQRKAVEYKNDPLLIIAGPGSGKTRVIIERVIHLTKSGIKPSEILCLTFTNKATNEMSQRLERDNIQDVEVSTFHAFAKSILEENVFETGISLKYGIIEEQDQLAWGLKNIDEFNFEHIKIGNNSEDLIESIIDGIHAFKNELILPEELRKYLDAQKLLKHDKERQNYLDKLEDLYRVYIKYQEFCNNKKLIDQNDIILKLVQFLKEQPVMRKKLQQRYKHILVDEFQDNNYAQFEIIKLISNEGNVTVVGDNDQSIFRFQGAYSEIFKDFENEFKNLKKVNLNINYRSTKNIVELTKSIIKDIQGREDKNLYTENKKGGKIQIIECTDENSEVEFVTKTIKELLGQQIIIEDGTRKTVCYRDFAVLVRTRKLGLKFVRGLKEYGFPVSSTLSERLLLKPIVKDLIAYLKVTSSLLDSNTEMARLLKNHGISEHNISKINSYINFSSKNNTIDILKELENIKQNNIITQKEEISEFINIVKKLSQLSRCQISEIVYNVIMLTGLYKEAIEKNTDRGRLEKRILDKLCAYAEEYENIYPEETLASFIKYLGYLSRFETEYSEEFDDKNSISVITVHKSKGKEFQFVFIVDVAKNRFPIRLRTKKFYVPKGLAKSSTADMSEKIAHELDEKKLLYVGATRAKSHLCITYSKKYGDQENCQPSKFLTELNLNENQLIDFKEYEGDESNYKSEHHNYIEKLKHDYKGIAIKAINQSNFKTAIQKIIDLAKIKHFEEHKKLDKFDISKLLEMEINSDINEQLIHQKAPALLSRKNFYLSASKINIYEKCPLQFKFQHVLGVPRPRKTYFEVGKIIHDTLAHIAKEQKDGKILTEEKALKILERYWNSSIYKNQKTKEKDDLQEAKNMIITYLNWVNNNTNNLVDIESNFKIMLDDIKIGGRIDRIEQTEDGEYEVIDFKTSKTPKSKNEIINDVQLNLYALGIKELYGKLPRQAMLFYVKSDKIVRYEINEESIIKFKDKLKKTANDILDERFLAEPEPFKCKNCDYKMICDESVGN